MGKGNSITMESGVLNSETGSGGHNNI